MSLDIFQVDSFTNEPFRGNPAGVCILDAMRDDRWLAGIAAEMNLSETAFLLRQDDGWRLRWFTPRVEVKLCGHATLAAAHVLWEAGLLAATAEARFHTLSGMLTARGRGEWIEMDFPAHSTKPADSAGALAGALGVRPLGIYDAGWTWLVEVDNERTVRETTPDFAAMRPPYGSAIVTARADAADRDFVCRFFAPCVGINEDPVTGSAHCVLGPFWSGRLGKTSMVSRQVSARGGVVKVTVAGDRVKLAGQAVTVFRGKLSDKASSNMPDA